MRIKLLLILLALGSIVGCHEPTSRSYQGYIEGELIYLSSPYSGDLTSLLVRRGQWVERDSLVFKLDSNPEALTLKQIEDELAQAKNIYQDLQNPRRIPELTAIQAQIDEAEAKLKLAHIRVDRFYKLFQKGAVAKDTFDEAVSREQELLHAKAQYQANLQLAMEGSREEQIKAQLARVREITAKLEEVTWQLSQKSVYAPGAGIIFDTYFNPGEFVNTGKPVASLLTPTHVRAEFFIPEEALAGIQVGQNVKIHCKDCPPDSEGRIYYISPEAEYAPPLVYSRENSSKLVFRIKASLKNPQAFKPGQPVVVDIARE